ncbi:MAG: hypothetical protein ABL883_13335 [Terricaulis sp.]
MVAKTLHHDQWRPTFIAPALRRAEPALFVADDQVGEAAYSLMECFFWGHFLNFAPLLFGMSEEEFDYTLAMLRATAARQHWDEAVQRSRVSVEMTEEFMMLFVSLLQVAGRTFAIELEKTGYFEHGPMDLMKEFLIQSESVVPAKNRFAAFSKSRENGDVLLWVAAVDGSRALTREIMAWADGKRQM